MGQIFTCKKELYAISWDMDQLYHSISGGPGDHLDNDNVEIYSAKCEMQQAAVMAW